MSLHLTGAPFWGLIVDAHVVYVDVGGRLLGGPSAAATQVLGARHAAFLEHIAAHPLRVARPRRMAAPWGAWNAQGAVYLPLCEVGYPTIEQWAEGLWGLRRAARGWGLHYLVLHLPPPEWSLPPCDVWGPLRGAFWWGPFDVSVTVRDPILTLD